jgi:hypothetical protein
MGRAPPIGARPPGLGGGGKKKPPGKKGKGIRVKSSPVR